MVGYSQRLGGNWFKKKTRSKKSRDTVPLSQGDGQCCGTGTGTVGTVTF